VIEYSKVVVGIMCLCLFMFSKICTFNKF
jgi:hypothetical protein